MSATYSRDCCGGAMFHFSMHWSRVDETDFSENLLLAPDRRLHPPRGKKQTQNKTTEQPTVKKKIKKIIINGKFFNCKKCNRIPVAKLRLMLQLHMQLCQFSASVDVFPPAQVGKCWMCCSSSLLTLPFALF